jgi:LuxR family maltose regulon positive regulatory protein
MCDRESTMAVPLLTTKLYIPPLRPGLVSRPRLIERLNAALGQSRKRGFACKLILICAPAGFGKTTLLSEWIRTAGTGEPSSPRVAWLSLDEGDNDPIVAALQTIDASLGKTAQVALDVSQPQPPPLEPLVTMLINDIVAARRDVPFVLALDDYHVIEDEQIHSSLDFLLDRAPPGLHLVITSRAEPALSLSRRRRWGRSC